MKRLIVSLLAAGALIGSTAASAGEVKGPPSGTNLPDQPRLSNGKSFCSFSGLNDTPEGQGLPGEPEYDPGGIAQSFGYFMATADAYDPSNPAQRESFAFPGFGCNPTRGGPVPG